MFPFPSYDSNCRWKVDQDNHLTNEESKCQALVLDLTYDRSNCYYRQCINNRVDEKNPYCSVHRELKDPISYKETTTYLINNRISILKDPMMTVPTVPNRILNYAIQSKAKSEQFRALIDRVLNEAETEIEQLKANQAIIQSQLASAQTQIPQLQQTVVQLEAQINELKSSDGKSNPIVLKLQRDLQQANSQIKENEEAAQVLAQQLELNSRNLIIANERLKECQDLQAQTTQALEGLSDPREDRINFKRKRREAKEPDLSRPAASVRGPAVSSVEEKTVSLSPDEITALRTALLKAFTEPGAPQPRTATWEKIKSYKFGFPKFVENFNNFAVSNGLRADLGRIGKITTIEELFKQVQARGNATLQKEFKELLELNI